jgi:molecular chaperone DnaJ
LFEREGSNLHMEAPISFSQAVLGTSFEIPLLAGKHKVEIPAGTQPGDVLKIRGEGLPHYQTQRRGDLLVHVQVEVPKKLTPRQSELIRELAELEHKQVSARQKSFLEKVKDLFVASEESSSEERS